MQVRVRIEKDNQRLDAGQVYRFRYVTDTGRFFDDDTADGYEPNEYGERNCLLDLLNRPG